MGEVHEAMRRMREEGLLQREIAQETGYSLKTVQRVVQGLGERKPAATLRGPWKSTQRSPGDWLPSLEPSGRYGKHRANRKGFRA